MSLESKIKRFDKFVEENPVYIEQVVENRWDYFGKQPKEWMDNELKRMRGWLMGTSKDYKRWDRFICGWLNRSYDWERPQDLKTYISNEKEIQHYKGKRK